MRLGEIQHNRRPDGELPPRESAVFDLLEQLNISYDRVSGDAADTMEKCMEVSAVLGITVCKNLFLCNRQKTDFYLLVMQPDKPFHTKNLSRQIGSSRLSFASSADMERLLGCAPGSATILGLMNDTDRQVRLLIDRPVIEAEQIICHPCLCTSSLRLRVSDVLGRFLPYTGHTPMIVDLSEE